MGTTRISPLPGFLLLAFAAAGQPAGAVEFEVHGDLNHRFQLYNNQRDFFTGFGSGGSGIVRDGDDAEAANFGDIKYRLWAEASTEDRNVTGVFGVEMGGVRFGGDDGGEFGGDGENLETRWAYVDFAIPAVPEQHVVVGLQPYDLNPHLWSETATGISLGGPLGELLDYELAWMRGNEAENDPGTAGDDDGFSGADNFSLNLDTDLAPGLDIDLFALYQRNDQTADGPGELEAFEYEIKSIAENSRYQLWSFGTDGSYEFPVAAAQVFARWDLIYQMGEIERVNFDPFRNQGKDTPVQSFDLRAFFGRADLGFEAGPTTLTYTFWYASGDDDGGDDRLDAFIATDVDTSESMIFFENMTDDDFFAETPYLLDKGFMLNKLQLDVDVTPKVTATGIASYHALAEDLTLGDGSTGRDLGVELGGRLSYEPYDGLEIATEAAYLIGGDAMDAFEDPDTIGTNGKSDENLVHWAMRVRYEF